MCVRLRCKKEKVTNGNYDLVSFIQVFLLTKDMQAASRRILTSKSSNCSTTSSHRDFPARRESGGQRRESGGQTGDGGKQTPVTGIYSTGVNQPTHPLPRVALWLADPGAHRKQNKVRLAINMNKILTFPCSTLNVINKTNTWNYIHS